MASQMTSQTNSRKPRVVLLTYPGLVGAHVINRFAAETEIEFVGVGLSNRVFKGANHLQSVLRMTKRAGWRFTLWEIALTDMAWFFVQLGGGLKALKGVETFPIKDVNHMDAVQWMSALEPDYIASCFFNQIIDEPVIRIAKVACINMHAALLPQLRGPEPCFRALERKLDVTGLTIHRIDSASIDTGPILHQERRHLPRDISVSELDARLWADGADVLCRWIAAHPTALAKERPQPLESEDYDSWPTSAEVHDFRANGGQLVDWAVYRAELRNALSGRQPQYFERA
ncbi:MAG: hypothetical protein K0U93_05855 [Gammaproteobacteria bacterium]|nr:hypothetical protein [Gammaproteobacteria bacterium]